MVAKTTGVVTTTYGRHFTGIDNNKDYLEIAKKRIAEKMGEYRMEF